MHCHTHTHKHTHAHAFNFRTESQVRNENRTRVNEKFEENWGTISVYVCMQLKYVATICGISMKM